jgi:uncharacterized membrane protein YkoI
MTQSEAITRRQLLALLLSAGVMSFAVKPAIASDGESGGGDSDSGDSNSGDSDSGGNDSDDGDSDSDDDSDDDGGSSSSSGSGNGRIDPDNIRKVIVSGKAISLSKAIAILSKSTKDRIIDVRLISKGSTYDYRFKVISSSGKVKTIKMDAKTGRIRNFLGL